MPIRDLTEEEKQQLLDWYLHGQDYDKGVTLYLRMGKSRALKRQLLMKKTDYLHHKLMQEMSTLVTQALGDED